MKHPEIKHGTIVDYLTGELTAEARQEFESAMEDDDHLKKEVKGLQDVIQNLHHWEDRQVRIPHLDEILTTEATAPMRWRLPVQWAAVAASIVVLCFFLAWMTNMRMMNHDQGVVISFGSAPVVQPTDTQDDLAQWNDLNLRLTNLTNEIKAMRDVQLTTEKELDGMAEKADIARLAVNIKDIKSAMDLSRQEDTEFLNQALTLMNRQQLNRLEEMVTATTQYLDEQRQQDIAQIQNALIEIMATVSYTYLDRQDAMQKMISGKSE